MTAVEWLIQQLEQELGDDLEVTSEIWVNVKKQALEKEKQQIINAFQSGFYNTDNGLQYYETIKNETK
jgi:hypothetical protein